MNCEDYSFFFSLVNLEIVTVVTAKLVVKLYLKLKIINVFLKFMVVSCTIVRRGLGVEFFCFVCVLFLFPGHLDPRDTRLLARTGAPGRNKSKSLAYIV